jgi:hypothetical protein
MYFLWAYENRTMKLVEIVLRRRGEGMRENDGRINIIKIHCKHICKCHIETTLVKLIHDNKNENK